MEVVICDRLAHTRTHVRTRTYTYIPLSTLARYDTLSDDEKQYLARVQRYQYTSILPMIAHMHSVSEMSLVGCNLDHIDDAVCELRNLQSMVLRDNNLTELPSRMYQLTNLMVLDISNNHFETFPDVCDVRNLQQLHACGNKISVVPPRVVNIPLRMLSLTNNNLSDLPDMSSMSHLEFVQLHGNQFTSIPLSVCGLRKLQKLSVISSDDTANAKKIFRTHIMENLDMRYFYAYPCRLKNAISALTMCFLIDDPNIMHMLSTELLFMLFDQLAADEMNEHTSTTEDNMISDCILTTYEKNIDSETLYTRV